MKSFDYIIKDEAGIHARPAGLLVKIAKQYSSKAVLKFNGKDEEEAASAIQKFLEENL